MSLSKSYMRRALAVGAASALGLSGLLVASPAIADSGEVAPTEGAEYAAFATQLLDSDSDIQVVGKGADGELVVVALSDNDEIKSAIESEYSNATVVYIPEALDAFATTDIVGGAGYAGLVDKDSTSVSSCSFGFSAWTPSGGDAIISAGHCAQSDAANPENTLVATTVPTGDPAGDETSPFALQTPVGVFGFHQFGGPGTTAGAVNDIGSVDISVIDVTNSALNVKPEITDWTTAASDDLSLSTTKVTAIGHAAVGQSVSKSGRTTGLTTLASVGIVDGWANISGHIVYGFGGPGVFSTQGDSGGAVFSGTTALGLISGGLPADPDNDDPGFSWAADLQAGLELTSGYTVKLFIEAPVVTTANGSDVERGANITGTGPVSTDIIVTPVGGTPFTVTTDASGAWSFPAPSALGTYDFTVQAERGYDTSEIVESSVEVVPAPLLAPAITTPANGAQLTADVTTLTGTGLPGATVTVAGDATGTATVAADGTFSVTLSDPLTYGNHELTVTQASEGQTSPAASTKFAVVLESPAVTSPAPGSSFPLADAPTTVSGTGIDGAIVTVSIDGVVVGEAEVVDGVWALELDDAIVSGTHTVTVTQTLEEISSATATTTFSVVAPVEPGDNPGNGDDGDDGGLATTGVEPLGFLGGAAALVLAGGLILVMRRRVTTA